MDTVNLIKKTNIPTHGWDYEKHLQLLAYDDEETYYIPTDYLRPLQEEIPDDEFTTSSGSPTTNTSSSSEDNEDMEDDPQTPPPPLRPKLPTNLLRRQDLSSQLDLPEVVQAATSHETQQRRTSLRKRSNPQDYAKYSKTGRK